MKLLIVQLSDMHCKSNSKSFTTKIDRAVTALKTLGKIDGAILVFSGDLTDSAKINEFRVGHNMIGRFLSTLGNELSCGKIVTAIVPGNHDLYLPDGSREIEEILTWNKDEHLDEENERLKRFFYYSSSKNCFRKNRLCDVKSLSICGIKIQLCLLNSAPFSTKKKDNKEVHHFPKFVSDQLSRHSDADLKISVMHHSYEWFDWDSKTFLKRSFYDDDLVFFGHDHNAEAVTIHSSTGSDMNIIMGGEFQLDPNSECTFNAVVYDTESKVIERYEFNWIVSQGIFIKTNRGHIDKQIKGDIIIPKDDYISDLLFDEQQLSDRFTDYYVLPKLVVDDGRYAHNSSEKISADEIFDILKRNKIVCISGKSGSGKTTLLKYLYKESIDRNFKPFLIEKRNYEGNLEKTFKCLFEEQYGEIEFGFERYMQCDFSSRIVFIDDFDLINHAKVRENLLNYVLTKGGLLVYTTNEYLQQDLSDRVKETLKCNGISSFTIAPFLKETRDELVSKICSLDRINRKDDIPAIIVALDYIVQCQSNLFSLSPGNIAQYIKYLLNNGTNNDKGNRTITLIFENNIRNAVISAAKESDVQIYLAALEYLAYNMYFKLHEETISTQKLDSIIIDFNFKRKASINSKLFYQTCAEARILSEEDTSFNVGFRDKNTFAYFVAKYINRELERDPANQDDLLYVMNYICFGLNGTIVLFLSYIKNNSRIILNIASKAADLLDKYPELDFDKNNIPFIKQHSSSEISIPTAEDKQRATQETEKIEQACQESIKYRNIFDYNEEDADKEKFRILRAFKYTQIVGRTLVDQYGNLEADELDSMVTTLYTIPQKILYALFKPYQEHYTEIIDDIEHFVYENGLRADISRENIQEAFSDAAVTFALNIMNDIAYNATSINTIHLLNEAYLNSSNKVIQNLMMEENVGKSVPFIDKALSLNKAYKDNAFIRQIISRVARKHILYTSNIDHSQTDRLISAGVLSSKAKKTLLIEQYKKGNE